MSETSVLFGPAERERMRRFVVAWEKRLTLDREHIATLRARLEAARRISEEAIPTGLVTLHSQVRVRDIETGRDLDWTVVLPPDEEVLKTARSPLSWSGATLLGRREGDEFEWPTRGGSRRVRIEEVMYQPSVAREGRQKVGQSRKPRLQAAQRKLDGRQARLSGEQKSRHRAVTRGGLNISQEVPI